MTLEGVMVLINEKWIDWGTNKKQLGRDFFFRLQNFDVKDIKSVSIARLDKMTENEDFTYDKVDTGSKAGII